LLIVAFIFLNRKERKGLRQVRKVYFKLFIFF
jgi:hypothetical protein